MARNTGKIRKIQTGWDRAIADAKKGIARLESAIGVFERRKQAGEPWPGDVARKKNKRGERNGRNIIHPSSIYQVNGGNMRSNNWYPDRSHFKTHEEWDAHVQTLNVVYAQQAKLEKVVEDLKTISRQKSNVGQSGGPINTTIGGFSLQPGQPANGDTLRYNSATGQFSFGV